MVLTQIHQVRPEFGVSIVRTRVSFVTGVLLIQIVMVFTRMNGGAVLMHIYVLVESEIGVMGGLESSGS